jgi:voltage-gated potassium channel
MERTRAGKPGCREEGASAHSRAFPEPEGRFKSSAVSVIIMLAGVTLFLRLARAMLRPSKVRFECPSCGLMRHEVDAVHCKACGVVLHIPDDNDG